MEVTNCDIIIKEDKNNILKILLDEFDNINEKTKVYFCLDKNKDEFTIIEKLIYDIVVYHFKRLKLDINDDSYHIECWTHYRSCNGYNLHIDVDEPEYKNNNMLYLPFLTTLTYFNDIPNPTMITGVTDENFSNDVYLNSDIYLTFPKMLKHISFEGNKYFHGAVNIFNDVDIINKRYILGMNLWKRPLAYVEKYNFNLYKNSRYSFKNVFLINKDYEIFDFDEKKKTKEIKVNKLLLECILMDNSVDTTVLNYEKNDFIRSLNIDIENFKKNFIGLIDKSELEVYDVFKIVYEEDSNKSDCL